MWKAILILGLTGAALCEESIYPVVTANFGSVGITHVDLRGSLVSSVGRGGLPAFVFRTTPEEGADVPGEFFTFRCNVLDDSYVTTVGTTAMFCSSDEFERNGVLERMSFLFTTEGISTSAGESEVELMLERDVVNNLVTLPGTSIGTTVLGDHA